MNDDLTDEQRARALELRNTWANTISGLIHLEALPVSSHSHAWLALEAYVLASHTCRPVWRPTTRDEIQAGWEVRSRGQGGYERAWGTAHRRDATGDWFTESGRLLTLGVCWTYETTAPEPEPDPRVGLLEGACLREGVVLTRSDAALAPDVVELRRLAENATPGPWWHEWVDGDDWWAVYGQPTGDMVCPEVCTMGGADESAYIAAASPDVVLGLLDRLAHMREARDNARAEVERLTAQTPLPLTERHTT